VADNINIPVTSNLDIKSGKDSGFCFLIFCVLVYAEVILCLIMKSYALGYKSADHTTYFHWYFPPIW
jgi:hypothetical protein